MKEVKYLQIDKKFIKGMKQGPSVHEYMMDIRRLLSLEPIDTEDMGLA